MTSTPSNTRRKVRALLAKTVANGCTTEEAASALQLAKAIAAKHLPPTDIVMDEIAKADVPAPEPAAATEPVKPKRQRKAAANKPKKVKRADKLMELIQRDIGVSLTELQGEFGILPHSARAYISVATRKHGVKAVLREGRYHLA